jgi:hypothetical protein
VSSTASSSTDVHCRLSGPALTLSPSAHDTVVPATVSSARPSWVPENDSVVPRMSASAPSPLSVTEQEPALQVTLFEVMLQPLRGTRSRPAARSPAAARVVDVGVMPRRVGPAAYPVGDAGPVGGVPPGPSTGTSAAFRTSSACSTPSADP